MRSKNSSEVQAIIPARMRSTRLPGKALADIGGRPMVLWVAAAAAQARRVGAVHVATDSDRIAAACEAASVAVIRTSSQCRSGTERVAEAARASESHWILNIQGDEPQVDPAALDVLIETCQSDDASIGSLMTPLSHGWELDSDDVVKVQSDRGYARDFRRRVTGAGWLRHVGVYLFRRDALLSLPALPAPPRELAERLEQHRALAHGLQIRMVEVDSAAHGVDTAADLARVRAAVAAHA